ncbi:zinc-binding dehydrogenase [Streptomyces anthocyanicus]|uniref:zinc-binding dehydrogenase n=1 Tax=Streptomyces anthocyanicus TaxID=68174 RepID=UPI002F9069C4|nr:zinc-binding dehydrogenase [Streptomyces anthocyanicus]
MKAYRYECQGAPLRLMEVPDPVPEPGWVVVDVEAAGLCHSDVHVLDGTIKPSRRPPFTLGHEVAGVVSAVGDGVREAAVGDRVAVAIIAHPQVQAHFAPGIGIDGGYAERLTVHGSTLVPVPDEVSTVHAAVATDSVVTAYHAVRTEAGARPGDVIAVVGLGGLGLNGVRSAALAGATVYGVDINPTTFTAAHRAGAKACFTEVTALAELSPDAVVDFAGVGSTTADAIDVVRRQGRVVLVGLGSATTSFSGGNLVRKSVQLRGSYGAGKEELHQVLDLIGQERIQPVVEEIAFSDLNEGLERVARGEVRGRLVTRPGR